MNANTKNYLKNEILVRISKELDLNNYEVSMNEVVKTNQTLLAIVIREKGISIAPSIYLDPYFEAFECEKMDLDEIVADILKTYAKHKDGISFDVSAFMDFDKVRDKIVSKLINVKMNKELLKTVPHLCILDDYLAIVFQVVVSSALDETATILIKNEHMKMWNTTNSELLELAKANNEKYNPAMFHRMDMLIQEIVGTDVDIPLQIEQNEQDLEHSDFMYVLTNDRKSFGSVHITQPEVLSKFCTEHGLTKVAIIPSSVHEVILVSARDLESYAYYNHMLNEVNATELDIGDFLGDKCMLFDNATKELSII